MTNPANGHRADIIEIDDAQHMPRKSHTQAMLALLLGASLAPTFSTQENTPHHRHRTPVKPPRQPKPLPQFEPAPVWKDEPQERRDLFERLADQSAALAEFEGLTILAANDLALAQDPSGGLWFVNMRPDPTPTNAKTAQHVSGALDVRHIVGKLAPALNHRVRARLVPHITTRQRRAIMRWTQNQEHAAAVLRAEGVTAQRFEMGGTLPSFEVARVVSLALPMGRKFYEELAAMPRHMVRFYAKTPAQFVGFDEDFDEVSIFRRCDEADADVWSAHERHDLEGLVGRSHNEKILDIITMTREVDHDRA